MKHLKSLILKSKLEYDDEENQMYNGFVKKAFEELNEMKPIEPILKIVANSEELSIVFDFNRDSVEQMIDTVNGEMRDVQRGNIYIAAKGLMRNEERSGPLSSLAQELCRFAMELIYRNNCKPYSDHQAQFDSSLSQIKDIFVDSHGPNEEFVEAVERIKKLFGVNHEFEDVLQATKAKQTADANISSVFMHPESQQHAELISRVPLLIVAYNRNQKKLNEVKASFRKLFDFFETRTLVDLQREFPLLEAGQEVKQLNDLVGYSASLKDSKITFRPEALNFEFDSDRVSVITSNCTHLTTQLLFQQHNSKENFESTYIFIKLESLKTAKVFDLMVKALAVCTKPTAIIDCGNESPEEISKIADHFEQNDVEQRILFIQRHEIFHLKGAAHFILTQSFTQLTDEAQTELLNRQILFQGVQVRLLDILSIDAVALKLIPLNDLLEGNIEIGKPLKFEESFHVERKFMPENGFEIGSEELLKSTEKNKIFLLTAESGMGKTSELKAMAQQYKKLYPNHWIVYIDLKELEIAFKRERKISKATKSNDEISRFFNEKVLKIVGFEAKIFSSFFNENRVVFLMDGIDEATPGFKQFTLNLILSVEGKTTNRIWISARSHMESELKAQLNAMAYNLVPFSIYDQKEFLAKWYESQSVDESSLEKKMSTIKGFLKTLEDNSYTDSSSNPMVLACCAEIFENERDVHLTEINFYTIFESFVQKKINNFMKKSHGSSKDSMPSLLNESLNAFRFHHRQALKTVFGNTFDEQLIQDCFKDTTQPPFVDMASVGLIDFLDNNKTLQFKHRMIAEFFVADFMFKKIFLANKYHTSEKRTLLPSFFTSKRTIAMFALLREIWDYGPSQTNYRMIRIFLDSKLKNLLSEKNAVYIKKVETIILKSFTEQQLHNAFRMAVHDGLVNLVHVLPGKSFWGTKESLNGLWIQTKSLQHSTLPIPLLIALEHQPVKFLDIFLTKARGAFDNEVYKRAFREVDELGKNIFHCAALNKNPGVFYFLLMNIKPVLTEQETTKLLLAKEKFGKNFMLSVLKKQRIRSFQTILKIVENNFGRDVALALLTNVDGSGRNVIHYAPKWIYTGKDVEILWTALKGTFAEDTMKQMFCEIDEFGQTPMTHAVTECDGETFKTFRYLFREVYAADGERREALFHESNEGFTAFHYATRNKCKEVFLMIQQAYKIMLSDDEIKALILRENYEGENILFFSWRGSYGNIETLKVLWKFMNELFDAETLKTLLNKKNYIGKTLEEVISNEPDFETKMGIFKTVEA